MELGHLGSALTRIPDYIDDMCDEDVANLEGWLEEVLAAVQTARINRLSSVKELPSNKPEPGADRDMDLP